jgi:hypothetical protein
MTQPFARKTVLLRSMSWRGVAIFFLFAIAMAAWTWSGLLLITTKTIPFEEHAEYFLSLVQRNLLSYFPMYVLVAMADSLALGGNARRAALGAALVGGALLAVQLRCAVTADQIFYVYGSTQLPYCTSFPTWRTYFDFPATFLSPLVMGALVMVFAFSRRRDGELVAALHEARAAQLESRRQRIESEIAAMHSRVDPDRLLETLRAVQARYAESLAAGEERLDALISELREAAQRPVSA